MSKLSDILTQTDFENMPIKELVDLEASLEGIEVKREERKLLRDIQNKIAQRYKKENMDRFSVHEIRSGLKEESWSSWKAGLPSRGKNGWSGNNGWKFHLDVVPNRNHPVTKAVSEFLFDMGIEHKIAHGGENGKGMTVYIGSYADIVRIAKEVQQRFGKDVAEPPSYTNQVKEEHRFQRSVYGRFVPGREFNDYPMYGIGIGPLGIKSFNGMSGVNTNNGARGKCDAYPLAQKKAFELGLLKNEGDLFYFPSLSSPYASLWKDKSTQVLRHYCAHKLYAEALGEYYCGTDLDKFEKSFFRNMIPEKGTPERQKWDDVAAVYVQESKEKYPDYYNTIKKLSDGYVPIDFSRLPQQNTPVIQEEKTQPVQQPKDTEANEDFVVNLEKEKAQPAPKEKKDEPKEPTMPKEKIVADEHIEEPETSPKKTPVNDDFKQPWRKFYQREAAKEKATYQEDKDSAYYKASLLRTNGEKLEITATPQHHVTLAAKDKDDKHKIPNYEDFNKLVLAAKEQGKTITFGNIKSPEFKARLLLACLENNVDIKTLPEIESMKGLETETRNRLMGHKVKLLKRMVQDKEKTGSYSGISPEENAMREKLEGQRKIIRDGKKNNQTDTPEFNAAREALNQRRQQLK